MYSFLIEIYAFPAFEIAMELMQTTIMAMSSLMKFIQLEEKFNLQNKKRDLIS